MRGCQQAPQARTLFLIAIRLERRANNCAVLNRLRSLFNSAILLISFVALSVTTASRWLRLKIAARAGIILPVANRPQEALLPPAISGGLRHRSPGIETVVPPF